MFGRILQRLIGPIFGVIDKAVVDKDVARKLKFEIELAVLANQAAFTKAARDIVVAEATGGALQRNWRPVTMLSFVAILVNNFVIAPYVEAFGGVAVVLEIPPGMWGLLTIGMGGYVGGRTVEKGLQIWGAQRAPETTSQLEHIDGPH